MTHAALNADSLELDAELARLERVNSEMDFIKACKALVGPGRYPVEGSALWVVYALCLTLKDLHALPDDESHETGARRKYLNRSRGMALNTVRNKGVPLELLPAFTAMEQAAKAAQVARAAHLAARQAV